MHISVANFGAGNAVKSYVADGPYEYSQRIHQFAEIQFVLEGELEIEVDGVTERLKAGDMAVIGPFRTHRTKGYEGVRTWLMILSNSLIADFVDTAKNFINGEHCAFTPSKTLFNFVEDNLFDTGENVIDLDFDRELLFKTKALTYAILEEYSRRIKSNDAKQKGGALARIILYLNEHFSENLTRESVGMALGYSKSYISHLIDTIPNMTFCKLLSSLRIERAKELLKNGEMSILDIALECGFGSERTFYRAFKESVNMTPREYISCITKSNL